MSVSKEQLLLKWQQFSKETPLVLKVVLVLLLLSLFCNFWFAVSLLATTPKVQTEAQILLEDAISSQQRMEAEPFSTSVQSRSQIEEALVLFYLQNRYRLFPDVNEMKRQFYPGGVLHLLSSPDVYAKSPIPSKLEESVPRLPYTQVVDVRNIVRTNNTWVIDFDLVRLMPDLSTQRISKNATITVAFSPSRRFYSRFWSNPYGQYVVVYQESDRTD